jgi:methionyl-tRNA formyltransferase
MDERIDSGDLLLQTSLAIPEGIAGVELEAACSREGAGLMVERVGFSAGVLRVQIAA